ncbi:MAG: tetratricopeptide repeat protein [Deltaproteobacteria bacterium]|nr:tetratricopeptide repeat protein [Deltaproteobacteria bacterium]
MEENAALYDEILKAGPSQGTLHIILARIRDEGRVNDVIRWCMKFLGVYPKDVYLRTLLAESYFDMGSIGQAETEFLKVSSMMNDLLPVYSRLSGIYAKQKRFAEATGEAEIFLAHHPEDPEMRELLKNIEEARGATAGGQEGRDQKPPVLPDDDAESLADLATPTIAELYFSQGQLEAAVETYQKVIEEHPDDSVSVQRLLQLKGGLDAVPPCVPKASRNEHAQEEKLRTILEKWLPRVGEIKYG